MFPISRNKVAIKKINNISETLFSHLVVSSLTSLWPSGHGPL